MTVNFTIRRKGGHQFLQLLQTYMIFLETLALTSLLIKPKIWKRYVDDVFLHSEERNGEGITRPS